MASSSDVQKLTKKLLTIKLIFLATEVVKLNKTV